MGLGDVHQSRLELQVASQALRDILGNFLSSIEDPSSIPVVRATKVWVRAGLHPPSLRALNTNLDLDAQADIDVLLQPDQVYAESGVLVDGGEEDAGMFSGCERADAVGRC